MTQPDQSELESDIEMLLLRVYNGEYDRSASQTLADVKKRIVSLITANYTPNNQPSTKITPVTDGVGGSESTNQSEHKEVK